MIEQMIAHPWEYTSIVQMVTPKNKLDYDTKEGLQGIIKASGAIFKKLPEIIDRLSSGGGWQVSSHSILIVGGSIMVSILLQRPKRAE